MKPLFILSLFLFIYCETTAQMGPPSHRLKAVALDDYKYGVFRKWDSTEYHYVKNREAFAVTNWIDELSRKKIHACQLYELLNWDTALHYIYSADTVKDVWRYWQSYSGSLKENWAKFEYNTFGIPIAKETEQLVYSPNVQLIEKYSGTYKYRWGYKGSLWTKPDTTFVYVYDPQNPVWALKEYTEHYYTGRNNNRLVESRGWKTGSPVTRTTYEYDNNSLPTKTTEYDASSVRQSEIDITYNYAIYMKKTETYSTINTQSQQLEYTYRKLYNYDTYKNLTETITQVWNNNLQQWDNLTQELYTYTFYTNRHYPVTYEMKRWDNGAWSYIFDADPELASKRMRLYYEKIWPLSVQTTTANTPSANLYPVPAQDYITIDIAWPTPVAFSVEVYDMYGRMLMSSNEAATKHYHTTTDLRQIPAGNYIMKINAAGGIIAKQFSVIK